MQQFLDCLLGKTVFYDYGGAIPLTIHVNYIRTVISKILCDNEIVDLITYTISEDNINFYTIDKRNIKEA